MMREALIDLRPPPGYPAPPPFDRGWTHDDGSVDPFLSYVADGDETNWSRELESLHEWPDLRTVLAVETIRGVTGTGKAEAEIRYFLTSCGDDPAVLVRAIRRHWSIENALHWVLDVTFREDDSRVRDRAAARNLALLRKIALNLVAGDRRGPASRRGRRKMAAWNDDYMLRIIAGQGHA